MVREQALVVRNRRPWPTAEAACSAGTRRGRSVTPSTNCPQAMAPLDTSTTRRPSCTSPATSAASPASRRRRRCSRSSATVLEPTLTTMVFTPAILPKRPAAQPAGPQRSSFGPCRPRRPDVGSTGGMRRLPSVTSRLSGKWLTWPNSSYTNSDTYSKKPVSRAVPAAASASRARGVPVEEQLQSLLDRIRSEGVERAEAEAEAIVGRADERARHIVEDAEAEAARVRLKARRRRSEPAARREGARTGGQRLPPLCAACIEAVLRESLCLERSPRRSRRRPSPRCWCVSPTPTPRYEREPGAMCSCPRRTATAWRPWSWTSTATSWPKA